MRTRLTGTEKEVIISKDAPTIMIGERINPSGQEELARALRMGDLEIVGEEAVAQAREGAAVIDVNVSELGLDEVSILPQAVRRAAEATGLPISIDTSDFDALEAALKSCPGRPLVNSVTGEEGSLHRLLPLIKERDAAVIGLAMDEQGIPSDPERRLAIADKILSRAVAHGISRDDVIIDPLAMTVAADQHAALTSLKTIHLVARDLSVNMTIGGSNVSFGLPDRQSVNGAFLALAISAGVTCPIVNPRTARRAILIADLLMGRDEFALRYIGYCRRADKKRGQAARKER